MNEEVKRYIEKQEPLQQEILKAVRSLILGTLPNCDEKSAWGVVAFAGDKFYIAALKNRVHVGFAINGLNKDEINLFEGSGKTMRHIKIRSLADIDEDRIVKLIKMVDNKVACNPC